MKIEFGSRWISKGQCIARVVEAGDERVITRWEGSFDDLCNYAREEFLNVFRPYDGYLKESLPVEMNSLWWCRCEEGDIKRGIVVGYLDGLVLLHDDEGDVHANPVTEFEGFSGEIDEPCWIRGNPFDTPRAEMVARMKAIQAELDELKQMLDK
jgi:hypothetical protein